MEKSTVLLVSADLVQVSSLGGRLKKAGYEVYTSSLGWETIELLVETRPDLLILDWELPDLSSMAVIRAIRSRDSRIPIALTGDQMDETDRVLALEAGADLCLTDTYQPQVAVARLGALLRRVERKQQ